MQEESAKQCCIHVGPPMIHHCVSTYKTQHHVKGGGALDTKTESNPIRSLPLLCWLCEEISRGGGVFEAWGDNARQLCVERKVLLLVYVVLRGRGNIVC